MKEDHLQTKTFQNAFIQSIDTMQFFSTILFLNDHAIKICHDQTIWTAVTNLNFEYSNLIESWSLDKKVLYGRFPNQCRN